MIQHGLNLTKTLMDYYRFRGEGKQDMNINPTNMPLSLLREEKNLIDFLPQHGTSCSEGKPNFVSSFGHSVGSKSSSMVMMDSRDSVNPHLQASKSKFTDSMLRDTSSSSILT